ncbi:hemerythrin domain-containing protein [Rhizobiaceae bacterium n13]|uniref:Hemerythrin domain-containing protein n=1 Tax=Ferirhizobium litorale TaxID=2927786 RepID=A0AAE3U501_9HYPH|nr:hemerythrin domain-containing protein [Fererhizobium litorale]MDI7863560.1 hemerythrin domain-containing protein [Fererhizobium litorale]MDI7923519.1 hemerythrin domain-containing protein [Fererhizobium litorale]
MRKQSPKPGVAAADDRSRQVHRPLSWLHEAHDAHLALCRELEEIADSLPANINRQKCIYAAKALGPLIRDVQHYEETVLFPWLQQHNPDPALPLTLERLKFEHFEDACFAEELTDILLKLGAGSAVNTEAAGYMLRGFFEMNRRHIAFEREYLLKGVPEETIVMPVPRT